ncbi:MAG: DUF4382 domain-containing protein [Acidobacteriota bacterium]|nr:DUF4382 domain-containing protein [Acidobacteriota bacterium]MDH3783736.1 DUF4382 domain-containing protein [Acidobacteriota bacterium]
MSQLSKSLFLVLAAVVALVSWSACSHGTVSGSSRITVLLTDAPIDFTGVSAVNVTIDGVTIKPAGDEEGEDGEKMRLLTDGPLVVNLLDYQNGATVMVAEGELDDGDYAKIRLHILEAELVRDDDGDPDTPEIVEPIFAPSRKIDVNVPFSLRNGEDFQVTLDFDAELSVQVNETGGQHPYILHPVIHVVGMDG